MKKNNLGIKVKPISKTTLEKLLKDDKKLKVDTKKIVARCNYIMDFAFKIFNNLSAFWEFESEYGGKMDFCDNFDGKFVNILVHELDDNMFIEHKVHGTLDLSTAFPVEWLYSNFEDEFINSKNLYDLKDANAIKKGAIYSLKQNEKMLLSIKKKLSIEELKFLNLCN